MGTSLPGVERVLVIGLGLIGASLAKVLREQRFAGEVSGFDRDPATLARARELGVIDAAATDLAGSLAQAGLVVLAVPTLAIEEQLQAIRAHARPDTLVTDVASVKGSVIEAARRVFGAVPRHFIPGHPIAGSERSGVEAASATLFRRHRVILTPLPDADTQALATVRALWECAGADVLLMDPETHDRVLALTSHLPHLLAFTLVDALAREDASDDIFRFAAGGFRDFTRIASSDVVMWRDIALANREALLAALDLYAKRLGELRVAIDGRDGVAIEQGFGRARAARGRYLRWLEQGTAAAAVGKEE